MREGIHPDYKPAKILCACGSEIVTRSTAGDFHVEICSNCHPFFTGKQKIMDTAGRIEKFKNRYSAQPAEKPAAKVEAPKAEAKKAAAPAENRAAKRAKAGKTKKAEPQAAKSEAAAPAEEKASE